LKILVTGGAGFVGSHITDALLAKGHEVIVVDNLSTGKLEFVNPQATFYHLDITDPELEDVFSRHKPEMVSHHAAQKDVNKSIQQPIFDAQVNILGTLNLLENCVKFGVERFIFASSGGTLYGEPMSLPVAEDHPERPVSPYGVSKLTTEHYLRFYRKVHSLDYVSLRYANIYGPRQDPYGEAGVVAIFTLRLLEGKPAVIYGDGEQVRDFLFVEDAVAANLAALELQSPGGLVLNIGTAVGTSVKLLLEKLTCSLGCDFTPTYQPARDGEIRTSYLDIQRARTFLGWSPKVSLAEGLLKTVESFKVLIA
jgi:UDP-glucose 4-epimerase